MPDVNESEPILATAEVAKLLHCSVDKVHRLVKAGILPCHRIQRHVRFLRDEILEFVRSQPYVCPDSRKGPHSKPVSEELLTFMTGERNENVSSPKRSRKKTQPNLSESSRMEDTKSSE